ncbi:recombinase family protein [Micromonospora chalcea]|uniref:recombinase family protein n=1 Tax=Micromonospora chalcea TaxID=1874 RepID=UPI0021A369F1|nr:recombinase family protein [Micromonospora chalcea]MCT2280312.1 recombinase family protein [Micromonospora chalcea]
MVEQPTLDIYARVSRLGDDRQRSTEGQVDDCTIVVEDRGAQVGEIHVDSGRSAWNPRVKRPGWDRMMQRLEEGATGGVIVWDLARFSRRPIEGERLIAVAEQGLTVLDSEGEYDLTSPSGKKAFRDQLSTAAYESDRLSTRVKRGKRKKATSGEPNVSTRPFGFEPDGITIREAEASVLRDLAERLLAGKSQDAMIEELNARGMLTSYGKPWTRAGLRQVLTRPRNAGFIVYQGTVVGRMPGDPILTEEVHNRIVSLYVARRRGRPTSDAYVCSGVVYCGLCQHPLSGRPRANMRPYPDGSVRRQYWCQPRAHAGGCGRIAVDQRELDRHIRALVVAILADPRHAAAVESAAQTAGEKRRALDAALSEAEQLAEQLADRLGRGEITLRRYDAAARPLDRRIADLQRQRDELDAEAVVDVAPEVVAASREQWQRRWDAPTTTTADRRALLRQALRGRRILVMPADPTAPRRFDPRRIVIE